MSHRRSEASSMLACCPAMMSSIDRFQIPHQSLHTVGFDACGARGRPVGEFWDQLRLGQTLNANRGLALEVGYCLVDHVHPFDRALPTLQVERWRISALPKEMTSWQVVGLPISIYDCHP